MYDEFEALETAVVAVSQEDEVLDGYGPFLSRFQPGPRFELVCDLEREGTAHLDRTTAYLVDKQGKVREIFPMIIHARPSWRVVLAKVRDLVGEQRADGAGD